MPGSVGNDQLDILFLLELLVDKVKIDKQPNIELGETLKETCVVFKIMDFPPIIVTEEDFVYLDNFEDTEINFKSGKSVLFSLPSVGPGYSPGDVIQVNVGRRVDPPRGQDHTVPIGQTDISLAGSFTNLMKECNFQSLSSLSSKTMKGTYDLQDETGAKAGALSVFIRLSCFGKLIVTEFEVKGAEASRFWFRGGPDAAAAKEREDKADNMSVQTSKALAERSVKNTSSASPCPWNGPSGGNGGPMGKGSGGRFMAPCSPQPLSGGQHVGQFQQGPMGSPCVGPMGGPASGSPMGGPTCGYPPQMFSSPPMSPLMGPMGIPSPQYGLPYPLTGGPQMMPLPTSTPIVTPGPCGVGGAPGPGQGWPMWPAMGGGGGPRPNCPTDARGPAPSNGKSGSPCLTDRETQVEDGDVKGQSGDKKSRKGSKGSQVSSKGKDGPKKKKGKK